jgi:hypothetical protein
MGISNMSAKAAYVAQRLCLAVDRLLCVRTLAEREIALRWIQAWATAYLGRMERRQSADRRSASRGVERRCRDRYGQVASGIR